MDVRFRGFERFLKEANKNPELARRALKSALARQAKQASNLKWRAHYMRWARGHRN